MFTLSDDKLAKIPGLRLTRALGERIVIQCGCGDVAVIPIALKGTQVRLVLAADKTKFKIHRGEVLERKGE